MGKFDHVLLASDFDDTLYDSSCSVSAENVEAIRYFIAEGGYFTVATGRANCTFAPYAHLAPINCPVVLNNGSTLYDFEADRMVVQTYLPRRAREDFQALAAAIPALGFEAYHGEDIYLHHPNEVTWGHLKKTGVDGRERPIAEMPLPWGKVILQQDRTILERARHYMQERWGAHYEMVFSNRVLLEITEKGSNKGGMVLRLADRLGVDPAHIYCVGDNENDLPMLAISALPFAPANCAPVVRHSGAQIVGSCDAHCIAEVIGVLDGRYS